MTEALLWASRQRPVRRAIVPAAHRFPWLYSAAVNALADQYRIERELGGGGMSRVWVATETALDRQVVVKVIAGELTEGLSAERFAREVRLAARLQQANIVPILFSAAGRSRRSSI